MALIAIDGHSVWIIGLVILFTIYIIDSDRLLL